MSTPSPETIFASALSALVNQNYLQSIDLFKQVLHQNPHHPPSHFNLGVVYSRLGDLKQTLYHYHQAIHYQPNYAKALYSLAILYFNQNQESEAQHYFLEALQHDPHLPKAYAYLGLIADYQKQPETARKYYQTGLQLDPQNPTLLAYAQCLAQKIHDYRAVDQLFALSQTVIPAQLQNNQDPGPTHFISLLTQPNPRANLQIAQWHSHHILSWIPTHQNYSHTPTPHSPIRLGYISYDLRDHVIGRLTANIFQHHSPRFQIFLYNEHPPENSQLYQHFARLPNFRDVHSLSSPEIAAKIHQDQIDILLDLTSFTKGGRPDVCALRPAPIQINYLGFPGSTGAPFYDYILADSVLIPTKHQSLYTEKILRLPWYLVTSYPTKENSKFKIQNSKFIFASLARPKKITKSTLLLWFDILKNVPNSVLTLQHDNQLATDNITHLATSHHLPKNRLIFQPQTNYADYLQNLPHIDLALDSPFYNGGGTTADLLWAGVPIITLIGKRYVERMGAAILTAAGIPELIAHTQSQYLNLAVKLATNPSMLLNHKSYLLNHKSSLFDTHAWVQNLERGLYSVWVRHLQGLPPDHTTIN